MKKEKLNKKNKESIKTKEQILFSRYGLFSSMLVTSALLFSSSSFAEVGVSTASDSSKPAYDWQLRNIAVGYINASQGGGSSGAPIIIWAPERSLSEHWSFGGVLGATGFKDGDTNATYGAFEGALFGAFNFSSNWSFRGLAGFQSWGADHGTGSELGAEAHYRFLKSVGDEGFSKYGIQLSSIFLGYRSVNISPSSSEVIAGVSLNL